MRKHLGRSFTELLNRLRIEQAAQWLARSDKPLVLIALETGFQDQSYFTKVFRRYTGKTPRQYRREHGKQ